ncbi:Tropomyosin-2 [Fasciola hepatica]|uniref:Tropomyosin-2 n=1 Tax=Fasciola hepatica TaxID=6192 RepID=A0A4E0RX16_FASHE|nr:Tropomyosin-2 [Fasciola hepatica]
MEHIKKKMQAMKLDKENALDEADQLEAKLREKELEMQTKDEEMAEIGKRIQQLETDKETAQTQLTETNQKLDETEKRATELCYASQKAGRKHLLDQLGPRLEPEGEDQPTKPEEKIRLDSKRKYQPEDPLFSDYGSDLDEEDEYLKRRGDLSAVDEKTAMSEAISAVHLNSATIIKMAIIGAELQNIVKKSVIKSDSFLFNRFTYECLHYALRIALTKWTLVVYLEKRLVLICIPGRKVLENRTIADEERINQLEEQLKESTFMAEDADRKYDEAARKLTITEVELERAESRLEAAESKITELEEELRIVGNNVKSLEISEQEAAQREEAYEENIRDLTERLKAAEDRAQESERLVNTLQADADRLEDELVAEKEKYKALSEELDSTYAELTGN